jgi:hypothetical protein
MPAQTTPPDHRCPLCAGEWIDGRVAIPIVGSLRFVYRLGTTEVATEVVARMCQNCGHVQLRARNPELIGRADQASTQSRPAQRWALRTQRPPGGYRSRYGQGN